MPQVLAIGAVTVDLNVEISNSVLRELDIEPGSICQVDETRIEDVRQALAARLGALPEPVSGGSVANTADLIARAQIPTGFVGVGGNDQFGNRFKVDCERAGMDLVYPLQDGLVTGYNLCFSNERGVSTIIWTAGANRHITPAVVSDSVVRNAELIVIDGFTFDSGDDGPATVEHAIALSRRHGVPYVITLASVQTIRNHYDAMRSTLADALFVVGNLAQAAAIAEVDESAPAEQILKATRGIAPNVVITLGEQGVYASRGIEEYMAAGRVVDVKDTTGAGDAFLSGFLIASQRGIALPGALAVGNYVASEVVQHLGARLPYSVNVPLLIDEAVRVTSG